MAIHLLDYLFNKALKSYDLLIQDSRNFSEPSKNPFNSSLTDWLDTLVTPHLLPTIRKTIMPRIDSCSFSREMYIIQISLLRLLN